MTESFSREKLRHHRRKKVDEKSCVTFLLCVTPAGTSNELDVQNEWEKKTHTHTVPLLLLLPSFCMIYYGSAIDCVRRSTGKILFSWMMMTRRIGRFSPCDRWWVDAHKKV